MDAGTPGSAARPAVAAVGDSDSAKGADCRKSDGSPAAQVADNRCAEAVYVSNYHRTLMTRWRAGLEGELDIDQAWEECLGDAAGLEKYAQSMKALGGRWLAQSQAEVPSRVGWCIDMVELFCSGGGLVSALQKAQKREFFVAQGRKMNTAEVTAALQHAASRRDRLLDESRPGCDTCGCVRLRVLDVGSCYDPFFAYRRDKWDITAMDLCPAEARVFQCDFVRLAVASPAQGAQQCASCSIAALGSNSSRAVAELPAESQQVVIFCLLLSFMPSPEHRWRCCLNAWKLLKHDGLLLIVSPMSIQYKPHRGSAGLKQWRESIEGLGFERWQQQVVERNHCMAYRKVAAPAANSLSGSNRSGALHMPRDGAELGIDTGEE
jgi:hypothetical protein